MYIVEYKNDEFLKEVVSFESVNDAKAFINTLRVDIHYRVFKTDEVRKYFVIESFSQVFDESYEDMYGDEYENTTVGVFNEKPSDLFLKALAIRGLNRLKNNPHADGEKDYVLYDSKSIYGACCKYGKNFFTESYEYFIKEQSVFVKKEVKVNV